MRQPALDINAGQMVRQPSFWMYYVWAIVLSAAGLVLVSQAAGIAGQVGTGISDGTIATVVGLISILNGIGRVFFGAVFDKKGYRFTMILDMIIFTAVSYTHLTPVQTMAKKRMTNCCQRCCGCRSSTVENRFIRRVNTMLNGI